ncbi:MAG: hypothetical protein N2444_09105 [Methylocystis sp.]|nr:hypothetical protein [Methylocystis sp.]
MRFFLWASAILAILAATPSFAQGTAQQRQACEGDANRLCEEYIPDSIAIEKCLRANAGRVSGPCRAELGLGGKKRR